MLVTPDTLGIVVFIATTTISVMRRHCHIRSCVGSMSADSLDRKSNEDTHFELLANFIENKDSQHVFAWDVHNHRRGGKAAGATNPASHKVARDIVGFISADPTGCIHGAALKGAVEQMFKAFPANHVNPTKS